MMNDQLSKHIVEKLYVATFENRMWFTLVYTSFLNKPLNLSLHPYVAKRDSQFFSQNLRILQSSNLLYLLLEPSIPFSFNVFHY